MANCKICGREIPDTETYCTECNPPAYVEAGKDSQQVSSIYTTIDETEANSQQADSAYTTSENKSAEQQQREWEEARLRMQEEQRRRAQQMQAEESSRSLRIARASTGGNGVAIAAFVVSFFASIVGLILGIIGLKNAKHGAGKKGFAVAAIIISVVGMIFSAIVGAINFKALEQALTQANNSITGGYNEEYKIAHSAVSTYEKFSLENKDYPSIIAAEKTVVEVNNKDKAVYFLYKHGSLKNCVPGQIPKSVFVVTSKECPDLPENVKLHIAVSENFMPIGGSDMAQSVFKSYLYLSEDYDYIPEMTAGSVIKTVDAEIQTARFFRYDGEKLNGCTQAEIPERSFEVNNKNLYGIPVYGTIYLKAPEEKYTSSMAKKDAENALAIIKQAAEQYEDLYPPLENGAVFRASTVDGTYYFTYSKGKLNNAKSTTYPPFYKKVSSNSQKGIPADITTYIVEKHTKPTNGDTYSVGAYKAYVAVKKLYEAMLKKNKNYKVPNNTYIEVKSEFITMYFKYENGALSYHSSMDGDKNKKYTSYTSSDISGIQKNVKVLVPKK